MQLPFAFRVSFSIRVIPLFVPCLTDPRPKERGRQSSQVGCRCFFHALCPSRSQWNFGQMENICWSWRERCYWNRSWKSFRIPCESRSQFSPIFWKKSKKQKLRKLGTLTFGGIEEKNLKTFWTCASISQWSSTSNTKKCGFVKNLIIIWFRSQKSISSFRPKSSVSPFLHWSDWMCNSVEVGPWRI